LFSKKKEIREMVIRRSKRRGRRKETGAGSQAQAQSLLEKKRDAERNNTIVKIIGRLNLTRKERREVCGGRGGKSKIGLGRKRTLSKKVPQELEGGKGSS